MVNGVVKNTPCCLYHSSLKSICEKLAAWMTEAMSTAQYAYVRLVQQSRRCQGQPAGSFLLLLVAHHTECMRLDRGVFRAHALDVVVLPEGSIAARVLAVRWPEHASRGFCTDAFCADLLCPCVNGACPTLPSLEVV